MRKAIRIIIAVIASVLIAFSAYKLITIYLDYKKGTDTYNEVASTVVTFTNEISTDDTDLPITVDFDELKKINPDVIGWLYCKDTQINYPVVQTDNNEYYLHNMINGEYNFAGTLFVDYRCEKDFAGLNTIIYGHNMKNGSMFGDLPKYKAQDYYDAHPTMLLLTPDKTYKVELLSGQVTASDSDAYDIISKREDLTKYLENAVSQSFFKTDSSVDDAEKIITLSTCSYEYENARFVVIGKLVEYNNE
ncbi:MAG: class B sortase [Oscillospiraceae bacterium]|nr:class B sortase [Candidatus Ruminococcus equi]